MMRPRLLLLSVILTLCTRVSAVDTLSYSIHPQIERQRMEGWGVSLCWWANMCGKWSDRKIDQIVEWMVSPTGLNYNIFRYNIGGGDDPLNRNCDPHHMGNGKGLRAEMEGFQDEDGGPYLWDRDEAQRKIMLKIKEKRPDAVFEAFSNSAPWWMTYSGCCAGNTRLFSDNLKPEYYEAFAHYLVDVCKHYKDTYGIEFKTLEPFNEPALNVWRANGVQEGCYFSKESQVNFLKVLAPVLKESGLSTVISSADETNTSQSVASLKYYIEQDAMDMVGQWNTHTYQVSDRSRSQTGSLARAAGKPVWMSEVGDGGTGIAGNLKLCQKFFDDMHYILPQAWLDWQYVEEDNDQWCTVQANFGNENSARRVANYYVRQQVTRFMLQGYTMVTSLSNKSLADGSAGGQAFGISPVEDYFYKIATAGDMAFDLQSNRLTAGTVVGLYAYGNSVEADTRNWQFVRVKTDAGTGIRTAGAGPTGGVTQYYDLSGKRLSAPVRGINILHADGKSVKRAIN